MRYLVLAASFAALFVCVVGDASAHRLPHSQPLTEMSLAQLERFQVRALAHARGAVRFLDRRSSRLSPLAAQERRFHRQMIRWTTRELAETRAKLDVRLSPADAIRRVFGSYADQALRVVYCETGGTYNVYARNGQYLGLFQMGDYARSRYGHSWTALGQARSAYRYFAEAGFDWSPWECKP